MKRALCPQGDETPETVTADEFTAGFSNFIASSDWEAKVPTSPHLKAVVDTVYQIYP